MNSMHEVDYQIHGNETQFVEIELDPAEAVVAEAGALMFMDDGIAMEAILGDGSAQHSGVVGALLGAGKRLLLHESLFMTAYQNQSATKRRVAFGAPIPGRIIPVSLRDVGGELITQKESFLCAAKGVTIDIAFQKRLGAGFFGGEGFILERLKGDGLVFIYAGGALYERTLAPGEVLKIDTGCITAFEPTVNYDIQFVSGIKTALFGGEGLFFATLRGPGKIWLQSLPFSRLAGRVIAAAPQTGRGNREEGSVLGGFGRLIDGDNRRAKMGGPVPVPALA